MSGDVTDLFFCLKIFHITKMTAFLLGLAVGAVASVFGAVLSYWFGLRNADGVTRTPLAYLMMTVLGLGVLGAVVTLRAISTGGLLTAIITGAGVVLGFTAVFALLLAIYIRTDSA